MSKDALASTIDPFPDVESGASQRMIAWMFVLSLASGIILGCAYVVSRAQDAPVPTPAVTAVVPAAAADPQSAAAPAREDQFRVLSPAELKGHQFVQVGVIDRMNVPSFVESLTQRGFPASGAEGTSPANLRIIIGPLAGNELTGTIQRLQQAGFATYQTSY